MSADELDREVNRLYWKTTEPVTRLAAQLEISRGTFYNHLRPLPADATCSACGAHLLFRTRSSRDAGEAHCGQCGADERLGDAGATLAAASRSASRARSASGRKPPVTQKSERDAGTPTPADSVSGLASRMAAVLPDRLREDERRTQLLVLAVSTAALGLGILYYSRHRS